MHISVGLRIFSENLDPETITAKLNIQPSRSWKRGEPISTSAGTKGASSGGWFLYSYTVQSNKVAEHLDWLVQRIASSVTEIDQLKKQGHAIDVCCNLSGDNPVSFVLPADMLDKIAALGLEIDFTIEAT